MLPEAPLSLEGCQVDLRRRLVARADGTTASLTAREVELLTFFVRHPDRPISREELLVEVWGYSPDMVTRTVDNTVRRLRTKVERNPGEPRHVLTEFGEGYRFAPLAPQAQGLPEGVVCLVSARVDGLHDLGVRNPELAQAALDVFDAVMTAGARHGHGVLVRGGEAPLVAFGEPHGAVSYALAVQVELLDAPWPHDLLDDAIARIPEDRGGPWRGLRVAIAVGRGLGQPLGEDFEGPVSERVQGLLALAHGGQTVIGPDIWRAVSPVRSLDAVDAPLGALVVRQGAEPMAVVAIAPERLAGRRFPPPRTADARRTNLDADVNSFVGRRAPLSALHGFFARGVRHVTVQGPAGAGKTRFVRRYGLGQVDALSADGAGVWFADLSDATSEEEVVAAVARALDVPLDPERDVLGDRDQVGRALRARGRLLLILDNAEQVLAGLRPAVRAWRSMAPDCRMLVTSRQPLGLPDEQVLLLPPLDRAESLALFVDRARAVRLDLELDEQDLSAIAQIAHDLDHNPLALELAAVRVRVLPPTRLAERLHARFSTLGRGPRDAPDRQATLDQAIGWSWGLLEPWAQAAFAQLAVFRGGFDLPAARAVIQLPDGAPGIEETLAHLRERSLLQRSEPVSLPGEVRFSLLLSLREWASARLAEQPSVSQIRARHRDWATARGTELLSELDGPDAATAWQRLTLELGNLREAHRQALRDGTADAACVLAVVLDAALAPRGPYEDHLHLLDQTVDGARAGHPDVRVPLLLARARAHEVRGDVRRAEADLSAAARLSRQTRQALIQAEVLLARGRHAQQRGRADESRLLLSAAHRTAERQGDAALMARVQAAEARWLADQGRLEAAIELGMLTGRSLSTMTARRAEAALRVEVAGWASARGQLARARALHRDALRLARQLHDLRLEARILTWLGALYHEVGQLGAALDHLALAESQQQQVGDRRWAGICRGHRGVILAEQGQLEEASGLLDSALPTLDEAEDPRIEGWFASWRAAILHRRGRPIEALAGYRHALDRLDDVGDRRLVGRVVARAVPLLVELGRRDEAVRGLARAKAVLDGVDDPGGLEAVRILEARLRGQDVKIPQDARLEARWVADGARMDHS